MKIGKRVKKLLGQDKNLETISNILNSKRKYNLTPKQYLDEYYKFMGMINPSAKASESLKDLISKGAKIHLFGKTGSGKTYLVDQVADLLGLTKIVSYARKEEDLIRDFGNLPFEGDSKFLFVLEGDSYYWRKYGLIRKYIKKSKHPFIVITRYKDTPTKNITKHLKPIKKFPSTKKEIADYFSKLDNKNYYRNDEFIKEIYDKDWRKIWRNYKYGRNPDDYKSRKDAEEITSKKFCYLLVKGKADYSDYEHCEHPLSFIVNWLGYNSKRFFRNIKTYHNAMSVVIFCDKNKYNLKEKYLAKYLIEEYPKAEIKGYMSFPPFQDINEDEEKEEEYEFSKIEITQKEEPGTVKEELGDFLAI